MSSHCDAVNVNVKSYRATTTANLSNYQQLQGIYQGYAHKGQVSALPTKTQSSGKKILQTVPAYGGVSISTQTLYGVKPDPSTGMIATDGNYFLMNDAYGKTNNVCGSAF